MRCDKKLKKEQASEQAKKKCGPPKRGEFLEARKERDLEKR